MLRPVLPEDLAHRAADLADRAVVLEGLLDVGQQVLRALAGGPELLQQPDPVDPRSGHIPGARSLSARDNVGADGRLLPRDELRDRFATAGIGPESPVVSYCGSGVTACHNLIALEHAGLGRGRLYPGSWSQWANDPSRPVATGS